MKKAIAKLKKLNGVMTKADFVAEFDEKLIDGEKIKEYKAPRSGVEMVILIDREGAPGPYLPAGPKDYRPMA